MTTDSRSYSEDVRTVDLRERMVTRQLIGRDITDSRVLDAMRRVPRHLFVPPEYYDVAYEDCPQPIGHGQTISQPYIVASMTQELCLSRQDRVLEIGTGSGYQAAILAELVAYVYTAEIVPDLVETAARLLAGQGYENVACRLADGLTAWSEEAPFDAIIVTAAASSVPPALLDQLGLGGRMVIPVWTPNHGQQNLVLICRTTDGLRQSTLYPVRFVPLISTNSRQV